MQMGLEMAGCADDCLTAEIKHSLELTKKRHARRMRVQNRMKDGLGWM
jgi:hypothetical protein